MKYYAGGIRGNGEVDMVVLSAMKGTISLFIGTVMRVCENNGT